MVLKRFKCMFAMYLHHIGTKSYIHGTDLIDAIKKRNQNAILKNVWDEDGTEYIVKEHEEADSSGFYNYYWINKETEEVLYDENSMFNENVEDVIELIPEVIIINENESKYEIIKKNRVIYGDDDLHDEINVPREIYSDSVKHGDKIIVEDIEYTASLSWVRRPRSRRIYLKISTYRGISSDAVHYYGKIRFDGIDAEFGDIAGRHTFPDKKFPMIWRDWEIQINRMVDENDIKLYPDKFNGYGLNYPTNRFNTTDELISKAKQVIETRFKGDWELKIEYTWK